MTITLKNVKNCYENCLIGSFDRTYLNEVYLNMFEDRQVEISSDGFADRYGTIALDIYNDNI